MFLSAVSPGSPRSRLEGLGGKVRSAYEEFENDVGGILG